jgi:hypothetical protein
MHTTHCPIHRHCDSSPDTFSCDTLVVVLLDQFLGVANRASKGMRCTANKMLCEVPDRDSQEATGVHKLQRLLVRLEKSPRKEVLPKFHATT